MKILFHLSSMSIVPYFDISDECVGLYVFLGIANHLTTYTGTYLHTHQCSCPYAHFQDSYTSKERLSVLIQRRLDDCKRNVLILYGTFCYELGTFTSDRVEQCVLGYAFDYDTSSSLKLQACL